MNFWSHFTFGLFTGLLIYYITNNLTASLIVFIIQITLILDFLFKKLMNFEPLHTVIAMLGSWTVAFIFSPAFHWYVILAYFTHLFLDIFVYEEIPLLFPFKKQLMFPIENSERFVTISSLIGSLIILLLLS